MTFSILERLQLCFVTYRHNFNFLSSAVVKYWTDV